jgi:biopolymer transport protein ExbB/TolQ
MIKEDQNIPCLWAKLVFVFLLFVFVSAFQSRSSQKEAHPVSCESIYELHAQNNHAVVLNLVQIPSFQKDWLTVEERNHFSEADQKQKIFTDNDKINHLILSLQKIQLKIEPELTLKFFYHLFSSSAKDYLILS